MDLATYTLTLTLLHLVPGPISAAVLIRSLACDIGGALVLAAGMLVARVIIFLVLQ